MSAAIYLTTLILPLGTILLVFGMRYFAQVQQAKAKLANDDKLASVEARLAAIEKILKDVG